MTRKRCADDYAALLAEAPIDVVCLGIGVNGHLAFNDPPVADLDDPDAVKIVELDADVPSAAGRRRRVRVPRGGAGPCDHPDGATATGRPTGCSAWCPGRQKRAAVRRALHDPVDAACPATALRTHPDCTLYLDRRSDPDGC